MIREPPPLPRAVVDDPPSGDWLLRTVSLECDRSLISVAPFDLLHVPCLSRYNHFLGSVIFLSTTSFCKDVVLYDVGNRGARV